MDYIVASENQYSFTVSTKLDGLQWVSISLIMELRKIDS